MKFSIELKEIEWHTGGLHFDKICCCLKYALLLLSGTICEENIDECSSHQCKHNATCVDGIASYTCVCAEGFAGEECEIEVDECRSTPCHNNATCQDEVNGFM